MTYANKAEASILYDRRMMQGERNERETRFKTPSAPLCVCASQCLSIHHVKWPSLSCGDGLSLLHLSHEGHEEAPSDVTTWPLIQPPILCLLRRGCIQSAHIHICKNPDDVEHDFYSQCFLMCVCIHPTVHHTLQLHSHMAGKWTVKCNVIKYVNLVANQLLLIGLWSLCMYVDNMFANGLLMEGSEVTSIHINTYRPNALWQSVVP